MDILEKVIKKIKENTLKNPKWLHFGAGNIFRIFVGRMEQTLLEKGLEDTGIIVAESFDGEIIDKAYTPFDYLTMAVTLFKDGIFKNDIIFLNRAEIDFEIYYLLYYIITTSVYLL